MLLGFTLGIHNGYIALWHREDAPPTVFPYRAEMLPEEDQRRLQEGIHIEDGRALAQLLEDYLS